jgi:cell cycle protein
LKRKKWLGTFFIIVVLILSALSLITMASLSFPKAQEEFGKSHYYLARQALWLLIGGMGFVFTANLNYKKYKDIIKYFYVLGVFTLVMVLLIGKTSKGATRWISIGGFAFQPSEFVKIILIITLATFVYNLKYATKRDKVKTLPWLSSISILGLTGIYAGLIIAEKSFSNTAQIVIIGLTYLLISEVKFSIIGIFVPIIGILGWLGIVGTGYRASRLASYVGDDLGYHTTNSLIAIGSGGFSGRFYGNGLQKYGFLPEIHTDYIFSGYAEENGFIGALFLLGLYISLLVIIAITLRKIKNVYAKYILVGIFIMFATQVIGNVAVVSNVIPSTGIPLPMMSYGGSTTIVMMSTLGIVYNIIRALYKQEMGENLDEMNEIDYELINQRKRR